MPISNINVEEIMNDERITPEARQLLFVIFGHTSGDGEDAGRWGRLRELLDELERAHYLMRGDAWKAQCGGHLLLFDRSQAPTQEGRLPPLPPRHFGRDVLYVIGQPGTSIVKIGVTRNVSSRLKSLQTGSPVPLAVLWWHPGSYDLEENLHAKFSEYRLAGEWFDFGVEEPDVLTELAVQRLRPDEFPPDVGADEDLAEHSRRFPPGCRYSRLLELGQPSALFPR